MDLPPPPRPPHLLPLGWSVRQCLEAPSAGHPGLLPAVNRAGPPGAPAPRGSDHPQSRAACHWARQVHARCLDAACRNWGMAARWTRLLAAAWAPASRTLGGRQEPVSVGGCPCPCPSPHPSSGEIQTGTESTEHHTPGSSALLRRRRVDSPVATLRLPHPH